MITLPVAEPEPGRCAEITSVPQRFHQAQKAEVAFAQADAVGATDARFRETGRVDAAPDDRAIQLPLQLTGNLLRPGRFVRPDAEADQSASLADFHQLAEAAVVQDRGGGVRPEPLLDLPPEAFGLEKDECDFKTGALQLRG